MKRILWVAAVGVAAVLALRAQRDALPAYSPFEVKAVFPREVSPARFEQVDDRELQTLAGQGWELVSVMPYIYRNEERGSPSVTPRPMVTQTYPAYFFKRLRNRSR